MISKTPQLDYWRGKFGDDYTRRNADLSLFRKRKKFFKELLAKHEEIKSILEIGCNIGGNLLVLREISDRIKLSGIEPNKTAATMAKKLVPESTILIKSIFELEWNKKFDLVFTSGVLIHIADRDIARAIKKMYKASSNYLLSIEYYSAKRKTVEYRGLKDALFKRPFDKEWLSLYPRLELVSSGFLTPSQGFDNCHWWLFKKP